MKKMLEVSLTVRCGNSTSETFATNTGAPQGDCASANEFTFYLAKSLGDRNPTIHDHHYISRNKMKAKQKDIQSIENATNGRNVNFSGLC